MSKKSGIKLVRNGGETFMHILCININNYTQLSKREFINITKIVIDQQKS